MTNTLQTMDVVVDKTWDLNGIELATYPAVGLTLYYDGEQVETATLAQDDDGKWTATFDGVPYRESDYTVVETITGGTFPEDTLNAPDTAAELFT
ncbi:MAG: Cna B-type domain-containing protein, partial [Merdibacter sp.]